MKGTSHSHGNRKPPQKKPEEAVPQREEPAEQTTEEEQQEEPRRESPVVEHRDDTVESGDGHGDEQEEAKVEETAQEPQAEDEEPQKEEDAHSTHQTMDPEEFNTQQFLSGMDDINEQLHADSFKRIDQDFPTDDLNHLVQSLTVTMENYRNYSQFSQRKLEATRDQMKTIKDKIYKKIQQNKSYEREQRPGGRVSLEERELEVKLAQLNKEIAQVGEELLRASQITLETEQAAAVAALEAERAAGEAKRMQEEYEAHRQAELELRKAEEAKKLAEEQKREEETARREEERKKEEARLAKLRRPDGLEPKSNDWESWPTYTYEHEGGQFDQGIGCIIRADSSAYKESDFKCRVLNQLDTEFVYDDNEELVANIVELSADGHETFQKPVVVVMPHCTTRVSAYTREPVIKAESSPGVWEELESTEALLEGHRDVKFVQAEVKAPCNLTVVTRFKKDFLHFLKRGGRLHSNVDPRIIFTAERGTFRKTENFILQLQHVDSGSVQDIRQREPAAKGLLTSSSIVTLEWASKSFEIPVTMTLPIPPNPVKAQKAAAARAAKEEKRKNKNNIHHALQEDEKEKKRRELRNAIAQAQKQMQDEHDPAPRQKPTRWYMGQYGNNDEDEHDTVHFLVKQLNGKWTVNESILVNHLKLDLVEFQLKQPTHKFVILRTRNTVESFEAQKMAETIEKHLLQRSIVSVVKQSFEDMGEVTMQVVSSNKGEKSLKQMEEEGYTEGSGISRDVSLKEGDTLEVSFRGNIRRFEDEEAKMSIIFNSQLNNGLYFSITEVDKFLQKSYNVYRGFVQIYKIIKIIHKPTKQELDDNPEAESTIELQKEFVSEHLVSIPKEPETPSTKPVVKAPVRIRAADDCLNEETLHIIADHLGEEWQRVANFLNVKRMRLQAIMKNNLYKEEEDTTKYDMLVTWIKKVPVRVNKVEVLCSALARSGRGDLSNELLLLDEEFQQKKRGEAA